MLNSVYQQGANTLSREIWAHNFLWMEPQSSPLTAQIRNVVYWCPVVCLLGFKMPSELPTANFSNLS